MKLNNITAVILTKNEEMNLERTIKSVQFCEKILVVDDFSTDFTRRIAKKYRAIVLKHELGNNFAKQRNFALMKVSTDWALFVDADEVIGQKLQEEILSATQSDTKVKGYYLHRQDIFKGKILSHGEWGNKPILRLGRTLSGKWRLAVHEVWAIKGHTSKLSSPLFHYAHTSVGSFVIDIVKYSQIHSQQKKNQKKAFVHTICYPTAKFLDNYIVHLGILDGVGGLIYSIMMSLHSYLAWNYYYENK